MSNMTHCILTVTVTASYGAWRFRYYDTPKSLKNQTQTKGKSANDISLLFSFHLLEKSMYISRVNYN